MDTLRRVASGEIAELVGEAAVPMDRNARMHGFKTLARQVLKQLPQGERALLEAYAAGVNSGLRALGATPFEYLMLRVAPRTWQAEDCILVSYAMTLDLQDGTGRHVTVRHGPR